MSSEALTQVWILDCIYLVGAEKLFGHAEDLNGVRCISEVERVDM